MSDDMKPIGEEIDRLMEKLEKAPTSEKAGAVGQAERSREEDATPTDDTRETDARSALPRSVLGRMPSQTPPKSG
ncbi:MAG: hypothetical protein GY788_17335 [bacterium]|nr:hypothetical protein [bacterium]